MYAVIETGSKQYIVQKGDILDIELLEAKKDSSIAFDKVLFFSSGDKVEIGAPYLKNVKVKGKVQDHFKDKKAVVFKYKRKVNYKRKVGHRQPLTRILIEEVAG